MASNIACPVCGMTLDNDTPGITAISNGQTVRFCSEGCRDAFVANPGAYAGSGRN